MRVSVTVEWHSDQITFVIEDTGTGIDPQDLPHIFEPFYTTNKEGYGVGLGLSTVYGIMEQHSGNVEVRNRPDKGTAFLLKLPFA